MKKTNLILLSILFLVALAIGVNATTLTLTDPAPGANINGTHNFTVTVALTGEDNISNCTFSTTADVNFGINIETNDSIIWNSTDTSALTEVKSTTITVTCFNTTNSAIFSDTSTDVGIDNTDPVCDCYLPIENINTHKPLDYDCSASTDTTVLAYSCVTTYDDGDTEIETAEKGIFDETDYIGEASTVCTVTDEVSKTNTCSTLTSTISTKADGVTTAAESAEAKRKIVLPIILLGAGIVAVILVTMSIKKGKKKK